MKKQWLSITAIILTGMAVSPKVLQVVANLPSGTLIESGRPQMEVNSPQAPRDEEWVIEAVDWKRARDPDLGSDRALRVDVAGNPHVVYGRTTLLRSVAAPPWPWMRAAIPTSLISMRIIAISSTPTGMAPAGTPR